VIRKAPYNLVTSSSDFSQSYSLLNSTITTNTITDPFGTLLGDSQLETIATDVHAGYNDYTAIVGSQYTFSVYVKSINGRDVRVSGSSGISGPVAVVNLSNGAILSSAGTIQVTNAGNGWYRISITATATTTTARILIYSMVGTQTTFAGDVTKGVYLFGRQLVEGTEALPYFPTTTRLNVPRIDYRNADGSLSTVGRLLLEPQRTNLITFSEQFDNAGFFKQRSSITPNTTTAPDGTMSADTFEDTNLSVGSHFMRSTNMSAVSGTVYSTSFFVKAGTSKRVEISLRANNEGSIGAGETVFNLDNGTIVSGSGSIAAFSNGWYRCTSVGTSNSTTVANAFIYLYDSLGNKSYTGTGTNTVFIWGLQIEAGAYATTYIPTTTAAVTRNADTASRTGVESWIGQTEGTVFVDVNYQAVTGLSMFVSIRPNSANKIEIYRDGTTIFGDIFGNSVNVLLSRVSNPAGRYKIALAYKSGQTALYINGTSAGTSATAFSFATSMADLSINLRSGPTFIEQAFYNQVMLFPNRLTDSQLQSLTTL
jgi:hypothetical protein